MAQPQHARRSRGSRQTRHNSAVGLAPLTHHDFRGMRTEIKSNNDRLGGVNPMYAWPEPETTLKVCRHVPGTLDVDPDMDEDDLSMYAVANGLAIERRHWPVVIQPRQIEPLEPTEEVDDKPLAYWYTDG